MTPALEAETELLLSQRTRDIRFSPEMVRAYRQKDWPQRSKIARAWMIWVALISMAFVPISFLLAPELASAHHRHQRAAGPGAARLCLPGLAEASRGRCRRLVADPADEQRHDRLRLPRRRGRRQRLRALPHLHHVREHDRDRGVQCRLCLDTVPDGLLHGNLFCFRDIQSRDRPRGSGRALRSSMRWESMRRPLRGKPSRSSVKKPSCCPCATSIAATR